MNLETLLGWTSTPFDDQPIGPACEGDIGVVSGYCKAGLSGVALLLLKLPGGERRYVAGDWRCVRDLAEHFAGRAVIIGGSEDGFGGWVVSALDDSSMDGSDLDYCNRLEPEIEETMVRA